MLLFMLGLFVSGVFLLSFALNLIDRTNRTKVAFVRFVKVLGWLWLFIFLLMGLIIYDHRDSKNIRVALEWTRLPPLPPSAKVLKTKYESSPFSANIWVTFKAPMSDVEKWLGQAQELKPAINFDAIRRQQQILKYHVPQDKNVHWGSIEVDESTGVVKLRAAYS